MGPGQPGLGQLGRFGLRGDHPGEQQDGWPPRWPRGCTPTRRRWTDGWKDADHLPAQQERAELRGRSSTTSRSSSTGRPPTRTSTSRPGNAYKGTVYRPFTVYYYAQLQAQLVKINAGKTTGDQAADDLQAQHRQVRQEPGLHGHRVVPVQSATVAWSGGPTTRDRPTTPKEPADDPRHSRRARRRRAISPHPATALPRRRQAGTSARRSDRLAVHRPVRRRLRGLPGRAPRLRVLPQPVHQGPGHRHRRSPGSKTTSRRSPIRRSSRASGSSSGSRSC